MAIAQYPHGSIEDRILYGARMSKGRMPLNIIVADAAELAAAKAFIKGRQNTGKLSFELRADNESRRSAIRDWIAGGSQSAAAE